MVFEVGQVIARRYLRGKWCTWVQPMRVVKDDAAGLLLWQPAGSDHATLVDADGNTPHDASPDRMRDPELARRVWRGDVLVLMLPEAGYSVWWLFQEGDFTGWYVNLEEPYVRRNGAVETTDHVLDIVVTRQRRWQWKDVDEFDERIGEPFYFDRVAGEAIRAEGRRLIKLIEAGDFPFDGTYTDFRPDPGWPLPRLDEDLTSSIQPDGAQRAER
jgi:protein associated with RNAse G/E